MTANPSLMEEEFHDWLDQCPNSWVRLAADNDSSTYKFYRKDNDDETFIDINNTGGKY
tara:strand:- start:29 stop:202 length:174 start_codon:yes stop_codon:yes gene_type:complete